MKNTVRGWALQGRIPKEHAKPCYIWTDWYGRPKTYYYAESDTREMTAAEKLEFDRSKRLKNEHWHGNRL